MKEDSIVLKAIPSNFQTIFDTIKLFKLGDKHLTLQITDALMEALPRPPDTCLCACNRMWVRFPAHPPFRVDGHGWDNCPASYSTPPTSWDQPSRKHYLFAVITNIGIHFHHTTVPEPAHHPSEDWVLLKIWDK